MKARSTATRCLGVCAALVIAAGCGEAQTQNGTLVPERYNALVAPGQRSATAWMAADAKTQDLLYVSNSDGSVDAYSFPGGRPEGRLPDLDALGLCSGEHGDLFILQNDRILQYAHAGVQPAGALQNGLGGKARSCAVDPRTGNLAVTGGGSARPGIVVYRRGKPSATTYSVKRGDGYSATFDDEGNLFVEAAAGTERGSGVSLFQLPYGGNRLAEIAWSGTRPSRFGAISWDGGQLAIEPPARASRGSVILRYAVSAGHATLAGETTLQRAGNALPGWIHGNKVAVPYQESRDGDAGLIAIYDYPEGGAPIATIQDSNRPLGVAVSRASQTKFAITTYHYDNFRTGWNDDESALTYKSLKSESFGLLHTVKLDDQVDAQPLLVPNETTARGHDPGTHDVVYVATENNTVFAIDASSGSVLFKRNLGAPVPYPLGCVANGPNVGINATPVIDPAAGVMYVIAYTLVRNAPAYKLHELNLSDLSDAVPPVVISGSHKLSNGSKYEFNAAYERQRPGLLEANGNVYAGFGSWCDYSASASRGWVLGWQAGSLTPLAANELTDTRVKSPGDFFLSAIWMAGYAIATDASGDLYFVTGNSGPNTYNGVTDIQESVVKMSADLTRMLSIFTPDDEVSLDKADADFGSGGALVLPAASSSSPRLVTAAGKEGTLFLLDQNSLGGFHRNRNDDLDEENIGGCWCGESYFNAAKDSGQRVVASGGNTVTLWKVETSGKAKLALLGTSAYLPDGQDPGFFTTVSSNGISADAIIWALARPQYVPGNMTLFALSAQPNGKSSTLETLWSGTAGYWAATGGDADLVPVVANGKVYVASYEQLDILGLGASGTHSALAPGAPSLRIPGNAPHETTGALLAIQGNILTLRARTGKIVRIDDSEAVRNERSSDLVAGEPFSASGAYDAQGVLHAVTIVRAKPSQTTWPPDR